MNILYNRLIHQQLDSPSLKTPQEIVSWLGAVQAQDFEGAKWAIAQRIIGATNQSIEKAFNDGSILRTHVLRPTWHFVSPADIRWMLELTAPRVKLILASYNRKLELGPPVFKRAFNSMSKALKREHSLDRIEMRNVLENAGINVKKERFIRILAQAELDGLLCSGPKNGKLMTYALLEERVPPAKNKTREEGLAELTHRYFRSHGPATVRDFAWWSGLTMKDVREGLDLTKNQVSSEVFANETYWFAENTTIDKRPSRKIHLLSAFDEYLIAYKDRRMAIHPKSLQPNRPPFFDPTVIWDGRVVGNWRRSVSKRELIMKPFFNFGKAEKEAIAKASKKYGDYFGMTFNVQFIAG